MKNFILLIFIAVLFTACATKPVKIAPDGTDAEASTLTLDEQYEKGYAQALKDNKTFLINIGFEKAMTVLTRLLADERAICAGKYAIEESFVTNPRVIATSNSNKGVGLKIIGCKIDTKKTPQELLSFYAKHSNIIPKMSSEEYGEMKSNHENYYSFDSISTNTKPTSSTASNNNSSNNKLVSVDVNSKEDVNTVNEADFDKYKFTTRMAKNDKTAQLLQHYKVPALEKESHYVIGFNEKALLEAFCNVTKQCER